MLAMLLKMSGVTALYILLTVLIWDRVHDRKLTLKNRILIGVIYGICSILSTHFAVNYQHMLLNVRDIGPLAAGLFFDPLSGILAGLMGGIERYIAGTYWGIGSYTRIACSVSTCLAGFVAAAMRIYIFHGKKPSGTYAFFMGAVMEIFHMYVVFITHRNDMNMAFYVVRICSGPMIVYTGLGLAISSTLLRVRAKEWRNPLRPVRDEEVPVSQRFQFWLFIVTTCILLGNFFSGFAIQSQTATQEARDSLIRMTDSIERIYDTEQEYGGDIKVTVQAIAAFNSETTGLIDIVGRAGTVYEGSHKGVRLPETPDVYMKKTEAQGYYRDTLFDEPMLCRMTRLSKDLYVLVMLPETEVFASRNAQAYETAFADILVFTVIYVLISMLVQQIVVKNLEMVNESLDRITGGDLDEVVNVRNSSEFASLSNDINQTVTVLKGYIQAAEKRIEQELIFARTIQESALPRNFTFPRHDFELFATMDPAKEVGGDFYDFFFTDQNKLGLVIADVSGKGIPAALFMMRAKTAIRGLAESGQDPAEIMFRANNMLCEGNTAEMFVTVWLGILDLETGQMRCANAGHEYPALMRKGGQYELLKDKHSLALAAMENIPFKEYELTLQPGDQLFVYTDGAPEAINEEVVQYGTDRLLQKLNEVRTLPMDAELPAVRQDIANFVGAAEQFDDITMLGLIYIGPQENQDPQEA